ncbi:putative disease resistance protein RGA4 [Dendrobium catenatum]|uniref:putative disease resistance protein RGA4 n=1 Tax=Dendrobium catenatum TaxID=906689 RepID=UPI0010A07D5F|nr:putative disease resistance protein RGA4 [Dendrobium catenatum]
MDVAGWFVGPIMSKIVEACSDYLKEQVEWQTGKKKELERLRENHPKIQAVVDFAVNKAQTSDQNPALNEWIWQLRDALDEVNDVLDELEYMKHKKQLSKNKEEAKLIKNKKLRKVRSMMKSMKKRLVKIVKRALKRDPNLKRLEKAVQKLDKVSADVTTFLHLLESAKKEQKEQEVDFYKARETGSLPTTNYFIGRGKDKESVVQWLRKQSNEPQTSRYRNISLLSIVGHGGMGKTTLLQHVYEDEMTKEFFDLKMWVCVSNNFDVKKVIADMLESLEKKKPDLDSLDALQGKLKKEVMSKRFLLVLDDVWEEEEERDKRKWGNVLAPLASGGFGSKILVTTRTDSVALMFEEVILEKTEPLRLEGLEEEKCLELLNTHAFAVDNLDDQRYLKLKPITAEIVKKLSGSPLAAKVIGGILNSNLDEGHWRRVLDSVLEIIKLGQNDIMPVLRLSYVHLPKPLKSCFTFCSIFPQDYNFDRDALVRQWIALGFIQPSDHIQGEIMEDIGERYFDVLVKKNFFDKFEGYYKVHDLMHELAQSLSIYECLRVEDGANLSSIIPKTLRYLSVSTTNQDIIKKIGQFKYLHALFLSYEASIQDLCNALIKIFKASRSLRLLYIWTPKDLKIIPKEIGNLIHLRYLEIKLEALSFPMLPRSVSNLYHLQYIIYNGWMPVTTKEDFLPSDINNLSNLRYMELPNTCISSICGIGKLKFLQELNMLYLRDVSGYRIGELENMNDLFKLEINCLENVNDAEEACSAKLCEKKRLTDLTLNWNDTDLKNINLYEKVLDNLQPPNCLRNLKIRRYMGARSAKWMNNVNLISNLEKIDLWGCMAWETLPPFGQLLFLKSLYLSKMPKVKWLESKFSGNDKYHAFPSLEVLHITLLEALEDWFEPGVAAEDGCLFPCLIKLELYYCPKLKELPSLPPKLKSLWIHSNMEWKTLNFCSNSIPIPLETLNVCNCPNITSLPLADEIARLAALRDLTITNCPNLISLGRYREVETTNNCHLMLSDLTISDPSVLLMEPLRSIASLKKLTVERNNELVSFPNEAEQWFLNVSSSLSKLQFRRLKSLESLPSSLESLSSLRTLQIEGLPMLRELPNLPPSLKNLTIYGECHPELKERYREDGGSDRHKIAHIPEIYIST